MSENPLEDWRPGDRLTPELLEMVHDQYLILLRTDEWTGEKLMMLLGFVMVMEIEIKALWEEASTPDVLLTIVRSFEERLAEIVEGPTSD